MRGKYKALPLITILCESRLMRGAPWVPDPQRLTRRIKAATFSSSDVRMPGADMAECHVRLAMPCDYWLWRAAAGPSRELAVGCDFWKPTSIRLLSASFGQSAYSCYTSPPFFFFVENGRWLISATLDACMHVWSVWLAACMHVRSVDLSGCLFVYLSVPKHACIPLISTCMLCKTLITF